jgi:predicted secreted Zn-dependent protease
MPPRSVLLLYLVSLLLLTACTNAPAARSSAGRPLPTLFPVTFPHATAEFYDVSGSTESQIRAELSARGPGGYDAYTKWYVRWNWPGQGTATCRLQDAEVSYEVTVTFPRWTPTEQATPELVKKWNGYLYALALHENGHVTNVVSHYPAIVAAIKSSTCLSAESAAQAVLQQMRAYDSQYDANTDHGRTQGARFP